MGASLAAIVLSISDRARSTACVISSGLLPALKSSKTDLQSGLKDGCSLLFRTIHNLWGVNPGFDPLHIIAFRVELSRSVTNTPLRERISYQQLVERILQI